jgi:NitT/TauT family transport system permease protein
VQSIDEAYFRAAGCLGSSRWDVFRHVVVPGALPFIFTGLQISIGVAWFSLVAAEMVSGDFGLGYLILSSYMNSVTVPMVIAMLTLGFVGWFTSAMVRFVGNRLMQWHARALALQGR